MTTETTRDTKTCPRCKQSYPPAAGFYRNKTTLDGYQGYCKTCVKALMQARKQADPDKIKAIQMASYERHKAEINPRRNERRRKPKMEDCVDETCVTTQSSE